MSPASFFILSLDQGTTTSRAVLFDAIGRVVASAQKEIRQYYPAPGRVEHDPIEIWSSQSATASEAVAMAGIPAKKIAAIGIANQRETVVVWNRRTGDPIHNAIVWQDRRTAEFCSQLRERGLEALIRQKTGLRLDPYFSATKIRWILDHVEGARAAAENGDLCFGTVDSWLIHKFTGGKVHRTDATNASRTLLYNLHSGGWDEELLEIFGIPRSMLPEIHPNTAGFGCVSKELFPAGIPICGVAGDQQAALFGQACFAPGMAKCTYGTGCFLLMHTGSDAVSSANNLLTTVAWQLDGVTTYALEGAVFIGGALFQWLRDELGIVCDTAEIDRLALSVPDAAGLYLVPAFSGLGAPHWDPAARGLAIGITRGTNRAHFCRAAVEAVAFQCADLMDCMERDAGVRLGELRVDGGACRSDPLLQFQADLLGAPVVRPAVTETTALGAAYFAGLGAGVWPDPGALARIWSEDSTFGPGPGRSHALAARSGWTRAVARSLDWENSSP